MASVVKAYKNWPAYDDDLANKVYVDTQIEGVVSGDLTELQREVDKNTRDIRDANTSINTIETNKLDTSTYDEFIFEEYNPLAAQVDTAVTDITTQYYLSTSPTELSGGEWSDTAPEWTDGKYMWTRKVTTYVDGTTSLPTDLTCIAGATGQAGENGTTLVITSSNGLIFKSNLETTILSVAIYTGSYRITDINTLHSVYGNSAYLQWKWKRIRDADYGIIASTDERLSNNGFTLTLSPEDIDEQVTFICELIK